MLYLNLSSQSFKCNLTGVIAIYSNSNLNLSLTNLWRPLGRSNLCSELNTYFDYLNNEFSPSKPANSNRWMFELLLRCGDVEAHPGPHPEARPLSPTASGCETSNSQVPTSSLDGQFFNELNSNPQSPNSIITDLQIMTLNVRGLNDTKKVRHLVNYCNKKCRDSTDSVFMFQESFVERLDLLKYIWRGDHCVTAGLGSSRGCVTLISPMLKNLRIIQYDQRAHLIVLGKNSERKAEYIVVNMYAPNGTDAAKIELFQKILNDLMEMKDVYECDKIIFAGDLNVVFRATEAKNRLFSSAEERHASILEGLFAEAGLTDGWMEKGESCFTWMTNRNGKALHSTLDRVFYGKASLSLHSKVADWSVSVSDHAAVIAHFRNKASINRPFVHVSRLNIDLLLDKKWTELLDEHVQEMFQQRNPLWDPHQDLEYLKLCIRTAAAAATGILRASFRDEEKLVNENINRLVDMIEAETGQGGLNYELLIAQLNDQRIVKRELVQKLGTKIEQRTARKWYNEGELSNKYFFGLLNRRVCDKIRILEHDGIVLQNEDEINNTVVQFYKDLYEKTAAYNPSNEDAFFRHLDQVAVEAETEVVKDITIEELRETLADCKDSAPGPDGISYSYLKHFWPIFGPVLVKAWQHSLATKKLAPSHQASYLKLIPKVGKDLKNLSNWRPITLSNTDHKLITKVYSRRLTAAVKENIGPEQTAYINGRLINENIRSMISTVDLANSESLIDGLLVSLDAKKAFDSVNHDYIRACLRKFGLNQFVKIFDTLYSELKSDIIVNGTVKLGYKILRGVKQGDALSCVLFIMCMEPLIRNIKFNPEITEIESSKLDFRVPKIYSYADDINVLTKNSETNVQNIFTEYERLSTKSGLILNADKTEIMRFKSGGEAIRSTFNVRYLNGHYSIETREQVKVNGIFLLQDQTRALEMNVDKVVNATMKHLSMWSTRNLSLLGKILIVKTFAISQMIYLMQTCVLNDRVFTRLNNLLFKFLWNKNFNAAKAPDRVKRSIVMTPIALGGFGMLDIRELDRSIKLRGYGRFLTTNHPFLLGIRLQSSINNFFDVKLKGNEFFLAEAVKFLNSDRRGMLRWSQDELLDNGQCIGVLQNLLLKQLITPRGLQSIQYLSLYRRFGNPKVKDATARELRLLEMHLRYPALSQSLQLCVTMVGVPMEPTLMYPIATSKFLHMPLISSKTYRSARIIEADRIICLYKIGLALTPGEVKHWTGRIKKLTSVRHRTIALRLAHGDIYSNSRLHKFGLLESPRCNNCDSTLETIEHKVLDCPKAAECWNKLRDIKEELELTDGGSASVAAILGACDGYSKLSLALNCELIQRIVSQGGKTYFPSVIITTVVRTILLNEPMAKKHYDRLKTLVTEY